MALTLVKASDSDNEVKIATPPKKVFKVNEGRGGAATEGNKERREVVVGDKKKVIRTPLYHIHCLLT